MVLSAIAGALTIGSALLGAKTKVEAGKAQAASYLETAKQHTLAAQMSELQAGQYEENAELVREATRIEMRDRLWRGTETLASQRATMAGFGYDVGGVGIFGTSANAIQRRSRDVVTSDLATIALQGDVAVRREMISAQSARIRAQQSRASATYMEEASGEVEGNAKVSAIGDVVSGVAKGISLLPF